MNYFNEHAAQRAREDAQLATFSDRVCRAAHILLTNRALASGLLQIDINAQRYADICNFLDRHVAELVKHAITLKVPERPLYTDDEEGDEVDDPPSWEGPRDAKCAGLTLKNKPCSARAVFCALERPYCRKHFPYTDAQRAQVAEAERQTEEYIDASRRFDDERRTFLSEVSRLDQIMAGLADMNRLLTMVLQRHGISVQDVPSPEPPRGKAEPVKVDRLTFLLETAAQANSFWIKDSEGNQLAILLKRTDGDWLAFELDPNTGGFRGVGEYFRTRDRDDAIRYASIYTMFYRLRMRRDLGWFTSTIASMVDKGCDLCSPLALEILCGIFVKERGWAVHRRNRGLSHREYECVYSGPSEAEARWHFNSAERKAEIACVLIDPANQIVEYRADSKLLW